MNWMNMIKFKKGDIVYHPTGVIYVLLQDVHLKAWYSNVQCRRLKGNVTVWLSKHTLRPIRDVLQGKDLLVYELSGVLPKNIYKLTREHCCPKVENEV